MSVLGIEKVIIYDENIFFKQLIKEILWAFEIPNVYGCRDLHTVEDILKDSPVDCLIMDWATKDNEQLDLVKNIRKGMAGVNLEKPILLCTANTSREQLFAARDAGVDEIVSTLHCKHQ